MNKIIFLLFVILISTGCTTHHASLWRGDFETGDLLQWNYLLNPHGLSVQNHCVYEGRYAGQATITGAADMLWHGHENLNRTEFSYKPSAERVGEGQQTFFGWSFYLPQSLSENKHEIGYWESDKSYQQMLRFNIIGNNFSFQETAAAAPFWIKHGFASPGVWRDVVLHIGWSTDPQKGFVQVWLDGEDMGKQFFKTLHAADESMFTQIGILRAREDREEKIYIDNVREAADLRTIRKTAGGRAAVKCSGKDAFKR